MQSKCFRRNAQSSLAIFTLAFVSMSTFTTAAGAAGSSRTAATKASLQALEAKSADLDRKALVKILRDFVEYKHSAVAMEKADLPKATAKAFADWEAPMNLPFGDKEMSSTFYKLTVKGSPVPIFIADYAGTNPTAFRISAVAQGTKVLGESVDVAN